jgi:hypothetical protein
MTGRESPWNNLGGVHNANRKPFVWNASAGRILEKVARAKQALESVH